MSIVKSSVIVSILSFLISVVSFFSQLFIAYYFGATNEMDMYFFASSFPLLFSAIITSGLSYSLTPFLVRVKSEFKNDYANILGAILFKLILISIIVFCLVYGFTLITSINIHGAALLDFRNNTRLIILLSCITGIVNILNAYIICVYNAGNTFDKPVIFSVFPYIFIILSVIFFQKNLSSLAIAIGLLAGTIVTSVMLTLNCKEQILFKKEKSSTLIQINLFFKKLPAICIAMLCFTIYQSVDAFWAPKIGIAYLSYLGYCQRIIIALGALVIVGPSTVLIPRLTSAIIENRKVDFLNDSISVIKIIIALSSFIAVVGSVLSENIVIALFQRGAFLYADTLQIASLLPFMLTGMVFMLCVVVLFRALFAAGQTSYVVYMGILSTIVYFTLSGVCSYLFQLKGFGISYIISWFAVFIFSMYLIFMSNMKYIFCKKMYMFIIKQVIILLLVYVGIFYSKFFFNALFDYELIIKNLLVLASSGIIGGLFFYILTIKIFRQEEVIILVDKLISKK